MAISKNNRVLIYRLGSLGDTIMALPSFHKIKNSFPLADITLLTNKPVMTKAAAIETILGTEYFFNRTINYPVGTRSIMVLFNLIRQIRALKIDTVVSITPTRSKKALFRDSLFFRAAGITNLIGFDGLKKEDFEICIDPQTGIDEWEAKRLARRIKVLGDVDFNDPNNWDLHLKKTETDAANKYIDVMAQGKPVFAISLGTKNQANDWGIDNWQALLAQLSGVILNWTLIILGAEDDEHAAEECLKAWGRDGINLCGKITPRISAALLKKAELFIGHDSGPIHLAACAGIPCVGIYSARNMPGQWFPRGNNNKILYKLPECAGCGLETCTVQQKKCILSITVNEVKQAVMEIVDMKKTKVNAVLPISL
jgi:heptosyltransferase-3